MAKCAKCSKTVTKKNPGVQCNKCCKWYHSSCVSLSTEQLCVLSSTDSDWKCRSCALATEGKKKRISVILPDPDDEESDAEVTSHSDQDKLLSVFRQEVGQLQKTVREIIRDELQNTLKFYSDKIDEYEEKIKDYEMRVKISENLCKENANTCKNLTLKMEVLEQKLSKLEQAQSSNEVEICGITEQENEDVQKIAASVCQLLNQKPDDIIRAHRKKMPSRPSSAQAERAKTDAPIKISLREGKRELWCEAAKTTKMTSRDLGGVGENKVYLRESLTPTMSYLLWKTKISLKEKSICKYVWCKNGQIMVRKNEGDKKIYYVRSENDIGRIGKELQKS